MDKILFVLISMMLAFFPVPMQASESLDGKPVKLTVKITKPDGEHDKPHRAPAAPIYVYQEDHSLNFGTGQIGGTLVVVQDGEPIYSDIIDLACIVNLPTSIEGTIEIQLIIENTTYWATIVL